MPVVAPKVRRVTTPFFSRLAVFDLETTGVDVESSRIVTAYIGVIDSDGTVLSGRSWLADPGIEIPTGATAVHGITTESARADGRAAEDVVFEIVAVLRALLEQGVPVTIYNAPYDLTLLNREACRYGIEPLESPEPIIDPLVLDKKMDKWRKGKRNLETAALVYGVELTEAHDASADAIAAGRVALAIAHQYAPELGNDLESLHRLQAEWCAEQAASFQEYKRRTDPGFLASGEWPERLAG